MTVAKLTAQLNAPQRETRLDAVRQLRVMLDNGSIGRPDRTEDTNNHVHTTYSFSPYSPSAAVWKAYQSGLATVGIVDHDSLSGAREFIEAGDILGITTTVGAELRVSFADTPFAHRRLNSPDEPGVAYVACHGIPHTQIEALNSWLEHVRALRNGRNRAQVDRLNQLLADSGIQLDFESEVLPVSKAAEGGSVTERHILFALAKRIEQAAGRGEQLMQFLEGTLGLAVSESARKLLLDTEYEHYTFDVLNVLKSELVPGFFIEGGGDSLPVQQVVPLLRQMNVIPTYCYLGDVNVSATGDKRAQKFEDEYLDELFGYLRTLGFGAIAYMPSRNTEAQLDRVMALCRQHEFLQISGEDINQPRQSFVCLKLREPKYAHLAESTWALVGHEHTAGSSDPGILAADSEAGMTEQVRHFRSIGERFRR